MAREVGATSRRHVLAALAAFAPLQAPEAEPGGREVFEAALAEAQDWLVAQRFDRARERLVAAIEEHPDADYVLHHWFEIEDLLAQAAFWHDRDPPEPADVVSGTLLSWNESSGKIRIRYRRSDGQLDPTEDREGRRGDFYGTDEVLLHPALFKGPYEVELSGDELVGDPPLLLVGWEWTSLRGQDYGRTYAVRFSDLTSILEIEAGRVSSLASSSSMMRFGRRYSFEVRVASSSITASYNGRRAVKAQREPGEYGQFGFGSFEGLDEVTITGEIEPSWIRGLVDERVQAQRREFLLDFDPFEGLPRWLRVRAGGPARRAQDFGDCAPRPTSPQDEAALRELVRLLGEGDLRQAAGHALAAKDASQPMRDWMLAHVYLFQGDLERALERCRSVREADPRLVEARLLTAQVLSARGEREQAVRELEQTIAEFPEVVDTYERLVLLCLVEGRTRDARSVVELAVGKGVSPRALLRAGRTILRSERGPSWGQAHVYETRHYTVHSNESREACHEIAGELEKFHRKYEIHVRRPSGAQEERSVVYFFSGQASYLAYTENLLGDSAENTLGLYSPWLRQLVLWSSPDRRKVLRTARHEGFHQYLHRITDEAPIWLNEGMAEYFEQSRLVDGQWEDGQVDPAHVAVLRRLAGSWTPLEDFVHLDPGGFRVRAGLHYPQAWALVHFLSSSAEHGGRLEALLDALAEGADREAALARAFDGVDWRELEGALREHVRGLE